jgi:hypothetical protein
MNATAKQTREEWSVGGTRVHGQIILITAPSKGKECIDPFTGRVSLDVEAEIICRVNNGPCSDGYSRANLIAAAPGLLEACREAFEALGSDSTGKVIAARKAVAGAIAKAEGK